MSAARTFRVHRSRRGVPFGSRAAVARVTRWTCLTRGPTVTTAMFRALDALAVETPRHERERAEHGDVCDDDCCIATAVIPAEGLE